MEQLIQFFEMNGHGQYVWASYGAGLLVFVGLLFWFRWMYKQALKQVRMQAKQKQTPKRRLKITPENS